MFVLTCWSAFGNNVALFCDPMNESCWQFVPVPDRFETDTDTCRLSENSNANEKDRYGCHPLGNIMTFINRGVECCQRGNKLPLLSIILLHDSLRFEIKYLPIYFMYFLYIFSAIFAIFTPIFDSKTIYLHIVSVFCICFCFR